MSRKDGILGAIGLVFVIALFMGFFRYEATHPEQAAAAEEEDTETGRIIWAQTPTATDTPKPTRTPIPEPTATNTPESTSTPTPEPTATNTPTPKPTPKATNTPTPAPILNTDADGYKPGIVGTKKVPQGGHAWKPYARHTAITKKSSPQYRLQQKAKTDSNGLRYVYDSDGVKRYCVALPVYWAGGTFEDIGRCFDVVMENGAVLHCCLGDIKKQEHSQDGAGRFGSHGELLEFQVDQNKIPDIVRKSGDISRLGGAFEGEAVSITAFDAFIPGFGGR